MNNNSNNFIRNHEMYGYNFGLKPIKKTIIGRNERIDFAAETETTLVDQDGMGVIDSIWFAVDNNQVSYPANRPFQKMILRAYVDEEEDPSIEFDCGSLGYWNQEQTQSHATKNVHLCGLGTTKGGGLTFKFPIPYSTHIKITIENPESEIGKLYSMIYQSELYVPLRLKSVNVPWSDKISIDTTSLEEYEYFDITTEKEGWLVWFSTIIDGVSDNSYANSTMKIYIDGEETPSISTPDLPSFFGEIKDFSYSTLFLSDMFLYHNPWRIMSYCNSGSEYRVGMALDLDSWMDGIYFENSCKAVLDPTDASMATDFDFSFIWLYYEKI